MWALMPCSINREESQISTHLEHPAFRFFAVCVLEMPWLHLFLPKACLAAPMEVVEDASKAFSISGVAVSL